MRWCALLLALLGVVCLAGAQQARVSENQRLSDIRSAVARTLHNLPNYVCTETIERSRRSRRLSPLMPVDRLKFEVAHIGSNEVYSWPGERRLGEQELSSLSAGGLSGTGAFGLLAHTLFLTDSPSFHYAGEEKRKGQKVVRYDFSVPARFGAFRMATAGGRGYSGQRGSFWADARSLELIHIRAEGEEIPPALGIRATLTDIEYQRTLIAGSYFLLPARAELRVEQADGSENRNIIVFSDCHKYQAESQVSFDPPPAEGQVAMKRLSRPDSPQPAARLPAGIELSIELTTPVSSHKSQAGDIIEGRLVADAVDGRTVLAPAGAIVRGRLRQFAYQPDYGAVMLVGFEFHSLETNGAVLLFSARMESFSRIRGITDLLTLEQSSRTGRRRPVFVEPMHIEGIGSLFLTGRKDVPAGFRMTWRTE